MPSSVPSTLSYSRRSDRWRDRAPSRHQSPRRIADITHKKDAYAEVQFNAADAIGVRGLIVHALSASAASFYVRMGFDPSPLSPMTRMVTLADLRACSV
jgi:hypothetical protein